MISNDALIYRKNMGRKALARRFDRRNQLVRDGDTELLGELDEVLLELFVLRGMLLKCFREAPCSRRRRFS